MSEISAADEQFMATVSHELRGPLHAILGLSELLMEGDLTAGDLRLAESLHREASAMRVLVDDVVAYGQFNTMAPSLTQAPLSPRSLVTSVVDRLRSTADDAGLRLLVEFDSAVPLRILGDAVRFGQVVHNLVSNALRYTTEGSVHVSLTAHGDTLLLKVRDTGHGISSTDVERIFEPFVRVGDTSVSGTGLGLAVVRRISEVMEGTLSVDSTVGVGTTFHFSFPCQPVADEVADDTDQDSASHGTVLVVEDSEINRTLATKQLEMLGLSAIAVESGEAALDFFESQHVDLVLMDWNLPGISGLETATAIRARELVAPSVPIIAMTANVLAGDRDACLAAGMNDHLGKPVSLADMRRMMEIWLVNNDAGDATSGHGPAATRADIGAGTSETTTASVQSAIGQLIEDLGDIDTVRIVVETYLAELSSRTTALLNPDPNMAEDARRAAHTLRSTSALLGAETLAGLCLEFEKTNDPDAKLRGRIADEINAVTALFTDIIELGVAA